MFKKYFLYTLLGIVVLIVIFSQLESMTQAKLVFRLAGLHDDNKEQFEDFRSLILENSFTKYSSLSELPEPFNQKLKDFHKPYFDLDSSEVDLSKIYASECEPWNTTDVLTGDLPGMQFRHAYCSENLMILIVKHGGIAITTSYELFGIEDDRLEVKNAISFYHDDIFFLALSMRIEKLYDFANEPPLLLELEN